MTADIPAHLLTPLRECPAGSRVVHGGEVRIVARHCATDVALRRSAERPWWWVGPDTRVLLLEGDEPRPLTDDDVARWVLVDPSVHPSGVPGPVQVESRPPDWWESADGWAIDPAWPVWPIVVPGATQTPVSLRQLTEELGLPEPTEDPQDAHTAPRWIVSKSTIPDSTEWVVAGPEAEEAFGCYHEPTARALADHLNNGPDGPWTPPEPEPERLSWQTIAADWARTSTDSEGWLPIDEIEHDFAEHGYVVVDRRALEGAGEWLKDLWDRPGYHPDLPHVRDLLAALYPEEADRG